MKQFIGDIISLIVGNTDEDFEPTKDQYEMFFLMLFFTLLFAVLSIFVF